MASHKNLISIPCLSMKNNSYLNEDIDGRANRTWNYEETHSLACKDKNAEKTGRHILECSDNDIIRYIPDYKDLFRKDDKEHGSRTMNNEYS